MVSLLKTTEKGLAGRMLDCCFKPNSEFILGGKAQRYVAEASGYCVRKLTLLVDFQSLAALTDHVVV